MAAPASNQQAYPVVLRRNQGNEINRPRDEITARQLANLIRPIFIMHQARLNQDFHAIDELQDQMLLQIQLIRTLTDRVNVLSEQAEIFHEQTEIFQEQAILQNAEITRLRNTPCNRLSETVSSWCAYL
jgi:hypothetical protein